MWLAVNDVFKAKWTEQIQDEWIYHLLENRQDLDPAKLDRTRQLMNEHVQDALVTGHEYLIDVLELPDPDDRHVLAAAIHGKADAIVTLNIRDFPADQLGPLGIEAIKPDAFITYQFDLDLPRTARAIREHRESLQNPPMTVEEYIESLERSGLVFTAYEIRNRGIL